MTVRSSKARPHRVSRQSVTAKTWTDFGLPEPKTEVKFHKTRKWRIDFLWEGPRMLAVEVHGGIYMRGAHSRGIQQAKDFTKGMHITLKGMWRMEMTPKQVFSGFGPAVVMAFLNGEEDPLLPPDPEDHRKSRFKK